MTLTMYQFPEIIILLKCYNLTEVAGEGGPDLAPQKLLLLATKFQLINFRY